jgi:hypothetical protein
MKLLSFLLLSFLSFSVLASTAEMRDLVRLTGGNVYGGRVPEGFRSQKLVAAPMNANLKAYLAKKIEEKKRDWRDFVFTSDEYSHLSSADRRRIAFNPWKELEVKYLLEIEEVCAIYKGRTLVGYYIQLNDHVQAAIYQDGAWINAFFNQDLVLVQEFDESA